MQCMKFLRSNLQNSSQKFHKNLFDFENPKFFKKSQKLRLQSMKSMKMRDLKLTKWRKTWLRLKISWERSLEEVKSVWEVKWLRSIERDRGKWDQNCECPLYSPSVNLDRSRDVEDLLSFKGFDRSICQACVQGKEKLDGSRICRGSIEGTKTFSIDPPSYWEVLRLR